VSNSPAFCGRRLSVCVEIMSEDSFTVSEFCSAERICRSTLYILRAAGKARASIMSATDPASLRKRVPSGGIDWKPKR